MRISKRGMSRAGILVIGICLLIVLIGLVVMVKAVDNQTALQQELNSLESNLSSQGYSWLIDYNNIHDSSSVGVYREGSSEEIARFTNITQAGYYKIYLTNLSDNESYDVFDLKSTCIGASTNMGSNGSSSEGSCKGVIPYDIYLMKQRVDEIRNELNEKGGEI